MTTTASTWKKYGDIDAHGAQEYRSHRDGVYMKVRMFDDHAQFAIGETQWDRRYFSFAPSIPTRGKYFVLHNARGPHSYFLRTALTSRAKQTAGLMIFIIPFLGNLLL